MRRFNKIFGIGISRTGTLSLSVALQHLGIPTIHWPTTMADISKFRGATDTTIACRFKELDLIFPNSLFIYTERNKISWLRSVMRHYQRRTKAHQLPDGAREFAQEATIRIYGRTQPAGCDFLEAYERHHAGVLDYFGDRPKRLLRINILRGGAWEQLCQFLDAPTPKIPFPHKNKS
jgi:hypothetical protein